MTEQHCAMAPKNRISPGGTAGSNLNPGAGGVTQWQSTCPAQEARPSSIPSKTKGERALLMKPFILYRKHFELGLPLSFLLPNIHTIISVGLKSDDWGPQKRQTEGRKCHVHTKMRKRLEQYI